MDITSLIPTASTLDNISVSATFVLVAILIITEKLVWHTRLKKAEERADRWERIALDAMKMGALAGVRVAEVAVDVVSAIPDPARDQTEV